MGKFSRGDLVIYDEIARDPTGMDSGSAGDSTCIVQHYMTVQESGKKGLLVLLTNAGKIYVTRNSDPNLRRAHWWEWFLYRDRFPRLDLGER